MSRAKKTDRRAERPGTADASASKRTARVELFDRWAAGYDSSVKAGGAAGAARAAGGRAEGGGVTGGVFPFAGHEDILDGIARLAGVASGQTPPASAVLSAGAPDLRVLDLGTGTGNLAERFVRAGCEVWGVDFSEKMLERAKERLPGAHLVRADLLELFSDGPPRKTLAQLPPTFDRIVSAYVFHEFDLATKVNLLARAARDRLAPGGLVIVGDIAFPTAEERERAHQQWQDAWDDDEHYWAADEALEALAGAGLEAGYRQVSVCRGIFVVCGAGATERPVAAETLDEAREFWNGAFLRAEEQGFAPRGRDLSGVVEFLRAHRVRAVLDAGCGLGHWTLTLARAGFRVTAVDISAKAVELTVSRARGEGLSVTGRAMALQDLTPGDVLGDASLDASRDTRSEVSFDAAVCNSVFDHLASPDVPVALANIRRSLRPGGLIFVSFDGPEALTEQLRHEVLVEPDGTWRYVAGEHRGMLWRYYSDEEIRALSSSLGFKVLSFDVGPQGRREVWLQAPESPWV